MSQVTAEVVFESFTQLATRERAKFFALLAQASTQGQNFSHDQVFGHLAQDEFTATEAAEYLDVSMSTFRRYVAQGKITVSGEVGRNRLYATTDLKSFKRSLQQVKAPK
ncbi:helix-turn-helix domain-containing protein [Duganella sp. FT80W]|uniref:Helix-turn-helix domain-containing protein n=1 Tax=Duganella guangzhouensis TaxID=2666084 RepID=A0A6I2L3C7_9BURK|nr:helix-turn-helix domain-containing protein [Duganella guangzhouensis]MRW92631.1 helix-turn-helix domain-containing protein [Duganella guangzhouensis]